MDTQSAPTSTQASTPSAQNDTGFEYGWCQTDHKTGREYLLDLHGVTILLFHKNTDNAVTGIYSPRSKAELQDKCKTLQNTHPAAYDYIAKAMFGLGLAATHAPSNTTRKTT